MKIINFFLIIVMLSIMMSLSSGFMPETHTIENNQAILQAPNSPVGKVVKNNWEDFIACDVLTDISVFYYFTEGFNNIGRTYKQTHTLNLCQRMVQTATNDRQLACAYGVCSHHVQDGVAHNEYVPEVIERTSLVNGLIHIFAEEDVNDQLLKQFPDASSEIRTALVNVAPVHKEFFRQNLVSASSDFPFEQMYDAFVSEVTGNAKFSVGFRGFTAVPTSIHVILILLLLLTFASAGLLIRMQNKSFVNYIGIAISLFVTIIIVLAYILFFTGKLWLFFQYASAPITAIMPTQGWEEYHNKAIQETVNFMNKGMPYVISMTKDPAGEQALKQASESGQTIRYIVDVLLFLLIGLFIYLNIRKRKK